MRTLTITSNLTPTTPADPIALIQLPDSVKIPDNAITTWRDLIRWLFENPELIAQLIKAIISIFAPLGPPRIKP